MEGIFYALSVDGSETKKLNIVALHNYTYYNVHTDWKSVLKNVTIRNVISKQILCKFYSEPAKLITILDGLSQGILFIDEYGIRSISTETQF